ncbi:MAG: cupin domain-containing protein [Acidobacteriota bacterium]|nr:cupin domain-containing protein [Acidobacteriota bacterium]MDH3786275.1 cupin domain-containing protein [Acidobacteriota bacterium]
MKPLLFVGFAVLVLMVAGVACVSEKPAEAETAAGYAEPEVTSAVRQAYPNLSSDVVFENDQMIVQHLTSAAGEWSGEHTHEGGQVVIALQAGTTDYRVGDEETDRSFAQGEVWEVPAIESHDHAGSIEGDAGFLLVTLAPGEASGTGVAQEYAGTPTNVVLENDRVIVQAMTFEPGVWSGEHGHPGGQIAFVIVGGTMTYREGGEDTERTIETGKVFEIEAVEAHDHAVTGANAMSTVLLTLK